MSCITVLYGTRHGLFPSCSQVCGMNPNVSQKLWGPRDFQSRVCKRLGTCPISALTRQWPQMLVGLMDTSASFMGHCLAVHMSSAERPPLSGTRAYTTVKGSNLC